MVGALVRKCGDISINQATGRGRPKLSWPSTIRKDMNDCGLYGNLALDRAEWRKMIHVANPK